jgi:hypothetical protein
VQWCGIQSGLAGHVGNAARLKLVRGLQGAPTIAIAIHELVEELAEAEDATLLEGLRKAVEGRDWRNIPGAANTAYRVGALIADVSHPSRRLAPLLAQNWALALRVFNTAFGPDVLVVTDAQSEGIDLHRWCRVLVHYELDPSPVRIIQRNGRVRRVGSWAARVGEKVEYAYPAFAGTRDERLVDAMRGRIERFDQLLGHVGAKLRASDAPGEAEAWRRRVLMLCEKGMRKVNGVLMVRS